MKKIIIILCALMVCISIAAPSSAGEWVTFKSVSKSASFELKGILTKPTGQGPFPAIVMLHGASGIKGQGKYLDIWAQRLAGWGYVSLLVDSFGPRGESDIAGNPLAIPTKMRAQDAYDAKFYLNGLSFVKQNQIAIMGWSHGGWSIFSATSKYIHLENRGDLFRLAIAFYPYCDSSLGSLNTPILILAGELDDWCPAKLCQSKMPSGKSKHETILKIYPGATHCFDWEGIDDTKQGHRRLYNPTATDDAIKQVKSFLIKYLK